MPWGCPSFESRFRCRRRRAPTRSGSRRARNFRPAEPPEGDRPSIRATRKKAAALSRRGADRIATTPPRGGRPRRGAGHDGEEQREDRRRARPSKNPREPRRGPEPPARLRARGRGHRPFSREGRSGGADFFVRRGTRAAPGGAPEADLLGDRGRPARATSRASGFSKSFSPIPLTSISSSAQAERRRAAGGTRRSARRHGSRPAAATRAGPGVALVDVDLAGLRGRRLAASSGGRPEAARQRERGPEAETARDSSLHPRPPLFQLTLSRDRFFLSPVALVLIGSRPIRRSPSAPPSVCLSEGRSRASAVPRPSLAT